MKKLGDPWSGPGVYHEEIGKCHNFDDEQDYNIWVEATDAYNRRTGIVKEGDAKERHDS